MGRKAKPPVVIDEPAINHDAIAKSHADMNELARTNAETSDNAHALAVQFGYEGALTVGAVEDEIRHYQRRTAEACFELGKRLLILKELTPHGEFQQRLDLLGIEYRSAQRFMSISQKFSKSVNMSLLEVSGTQGKLLELLVLDDSEIEELEAGETVRGLNLDKIETMSVRELKAALREAQADADATDRVLAGNQKTITKLQKELSREIDPQAEWSEAMRGLNAHVAAHRNTFVESVAALDVIREKVMEQTAEPGAEAALAAARVMIGHELLAAIQRAEEVVAAVRHRFDVTLGALID